jgi:hypothetical protein
MSNKSITSIQARMSQSDSPLSTYTNMSDFEYDEDMNEDMSMNNSYKLESNIDQLTNYISNLAVKNPICEFCKSNAQLSERIIGLCPCNCTYYCHEACFIQWIVTKQNNAFCMICTLPYTLELINKYVSHANRINRLYGNVSKLPAY